jgi:carbohydrate-selective porin OprB
MTKGKLVTFQWLAGNPHSWTEQEEVAMTRTAIRHTLSALAALALVSAFAAAPASAQGTMTHELGHYLGLDHTLTNKKNGCEG